MIRLVFFLLFIASLGSITAQNIFEDFSDTDLTTNPEWKGDLSDFLVNGDNQLQLNASEAGTSSISAPFVLADSSLINFWFQLEFSPSGTNQLEIHLMSAGEDLETSDSYFIRLGETGTGDSLRFFKRLAGAETQLWVANILNESSSPSYRINIEKNEDQLSVSIDSEGGTSFQNLGGFSDGEIVNSGTKYFGFLCTYTSTRTDKFLFDDIEVGEKMLDEIGPEIRSSQLISPAEIEFVFSEELDPSSLSNLVLEWDPSYSGQVTPAINNNQLNLALLPELLASTNYDLKVSGLTDLSANLMTPFEGSYSYVETISAEEFDLIITEIMADPTPTIGLPNAEYIEIHNRSNKALNLKELSLTSGTNVVELDSMIILPGEYLLVIDEDDAALFNAIPNKLLVENLFAITNGGDDVSIVDETGLVIDEVTFNLSWHENTTKADGGYSLEMISIDAPCIGSRNWTSSSSLSGGTPGLENSVNDVNNYNDGPKALSAFPISTDSIRVVFDRKLSSNLSLDNFSIEAIDIDGVSRVPNEPTSLILSLNDQLIDGTIYELEIRFGLEDCVQMSSTTDQSIKFALPSRAELGDLIINEVLFDPYPSASDFIEIYNNSQKVIALDDLTLRNADRDETVNLTVSGSIFPGEYRVFSSDVTSVSNNYSVPNPDWLLETKIPGLNNDRGLIQIGYLDLFGLELIDEMEYQEDYHYIFLDDTEGVSLEKIYFNAEGLDQNSWFSAASSIGFASPTGFNSQAQEENEESNNTLTLTRNRFSPDFDGYEDFIVLNYKLDKAGYSATVKIFSDEGREIKSLEQSVPVGVSGIYRWDGLDEEDKLSPIGIYIFLLEFTHSDGDVITEKLPFSLVSKL